MTTWYTIRTVLAECAKKFPKVVVPVHTATSSLCVSSTSCSNVLLSVFLTGATPLDGGWSVQFGGHFLSDMD